MIGLAAAARPAMQIDRRQAAAPSDRFDMDVVAIANG
jgi:hypothetical protein